MLSVFVFFFCFSLLYIGGNEVIFEKYHWRKPYDYYYRTIEEKLQVMLLRGCETAYKMLPANSEPVAPSSSDVIHVVSYSIDPQVYKWWIRIPRPKQMRVDPRLCDGVYKKKKPIFNNTVGCQLPDYMSPSAPRCQPKYLQWICNESALDIFERKRNAFVLPESDHPNWLTPPTPWILIVRDSVVNFCGHIVTTCGLIHTNANCKALAYYTQSRAFEASCPLTKIRKVVTVQRVFVLHLSFVFLQTFEVQSGSAFSNTANSTVFLCDRGAPWSNDVHQVEKVFVVAEVDDTYIYHIHLGKHNPFLGFVF
jgi:hypothetical protein